MWNFLFETFRLALKNLRLHMLRSFLTALGIIFGVGSVIAMVALGEGGKRAAMEQVERLGATNIVVRSIKPPESSDAGQRTTRVLTYGLTRNDYSLLRTLPKIETSVCLRDTEAKVKRGDIQASSNAIAATPEIFYIMNLGTERGRFFTQNDFDDKAHVCVLGALAAQQLFPYSDPMHQEVWVGMPGMASVMLTVVGVLQPTGLRADASGMVNRNLDQDLYFPLSLSEDTFGDNIFRRQAGTFERKNLQLSEIWLRVDHISNVEEVAGLATNAMKSAHDAKLDLEIKAPIQLLRDAERTARTFNFVFGAIAGISLLVGGIGIMNIMLAAVTERTREIGIRRALGAKQRHIILQFLIETTVISIIGGIIGIGTGILLAYLLPYLATIVQPGSPLRSSIAMWSIVTSFAISGGIGILFGLYPAIKASAMNPIEALRHE